MAKKLPSPFSESSLSPPPDDLAARTETVTVTTKGMKRKAATGSSAEVTKRVKKTKVVEVNTDDAVALTDQSPRPKRRAPKQATVEDAADEGFKVEVGGDVKTKVTKRTTTRKKKDEILAPLKERTNGTSLVVGAHVSSAGG
jgi:AP endonuclease-1